MTAVAAMPGRPWGGVSGPVRVAERTWSEHGNEPGSTGRRANPTSSRFALVGQGGSRGTRTHNLRIKSHPRPCRLVSLQSGKCRSVCIGVARRVNPGTSSAARPAPATTGRHPATTWERPSNATAPSPTDNNAQVKDQAEPELRGETRGSVRGRRRRRTGTTPAPAPPRPQRRGRIERGGAAG
jgi:hypothetical protein